MYNIYYKGVYKMDLYDRINGLLAERRISKRKLSIDLGIPYTTLASMFQRRSMSVDVDTMGKIANYLDTTLEYLISGNEKYKHKKAEKEDKCCVSLVIPGFGSSTYYLSENDIKAIKTILDKMEHKL